MIKNVRHTGIVVTDLQKALYFYGELLGFKTYKQMDESGSYIDNMLGLKNVKVTTVKMSAPEGGGAIELLKFDSHPGEGSDYPACEVGVGHIALTVENLDKTYAHLTSRGVKFNAPPQNSPDGYAKVTFCRDPDGGLVELVEVVQR